MRHLVESLVRHMVPARHGPALAVEQVRPPEPRGPSHATYAAERSAILTSLERRAVRIAETLNALPGISCNPAEGAMYLFPQLALPPRAQKSETFG